MFHESGIIFLFHETADLSTLQYIETFSYPYPLQTVMSWGKSNILFQNIIANLGVFILIGFILSRYIPALSKWKNFVILQSILSVSLALSRTLLHTGVFSLDQIVLWILSGLIGFGVNFYLSRKRFQM